MELTKILSLRCLVKRAPEFLLVIRPRTIIPQDLRLGELVPIPHKRARDKGFLPTCLLFLAFLVSTCIKISHEIAVVFYLEENIHVQMSVKSALL